MNITGNVAGSKTAAGSLVVGIGGLGGDATMHPLLPQSSQEQSQPKEMNQARSKCRALVVVVAKAGWRFQVPHSHQRVGGTASVGIGGAGGGGGDAGKVDSTVSAAGSGTAAFKTEGKKSPGIVAQSIGGGGGSGGMNISGGLNFTGESGANVQVGVGGLGGGGGDANEVTLTATGDVETLQDGSHGVVAQSIGGGGGTGGMNISGGVGLNFSGSSTSGGATIGIGGFGGSAGDAGPVTLVYEGTINAAKNLATSSATFDPATSADLDLGSGAYGVIAQSIGGAGGTGGMNISGDCRFRQIKAVVVQAWLLALAVTAALEAMPIKWT